MTTCHGDPGCTGKVKDLNFHVENAGGIDIGPDTNNDSRNSSDTTFAFGGFEADCCLCITNGNIALPLVLLLIGGTLLLIHLGGSRHLAQDVQLIISICGLKLHILYDLRSTLMLLQ